MKNIRIATFGQCRDLVGKCEVFIKNKAKIAGRGAAYSSKFLFVSSKEKFCVRGVVSQEIGSHLWRDKWVHNASITITRLLVYLYSMMSVAG